MTATEQLITDLIFIVMHGMLFLYNFLSRDRKLLQPGVLFSLIWLIVVLLHFVLRFTLLPGLFPMSTEVQLVYFSGSFLFSLMSYWATKLFSPKQNPDYDSSEIITKKDFQISLNLRLLFLMILIVGLPFYIQAAYQMFLASKIDDFLVGLKYELSYGEETFGPLKYLMGLSFVVFSINYYSYYKEKNRINFWVLLINVLITLSYAVFAAGRTYYVVMIALYLGINYSMNQRLQLKKYLLFITFFLLFFMSLGLFMGKGGNVDNNLKENLRESGEYTATYLVTSLSAFDNQMHDHNIPSSNGSQTMRFFEVIGQKMNLVPYKQTHDLVLPFIFVPYPTNVYTYYSPYFSDFGVLYALIMLSLFSFLHTYLYIKATTGNQFSFKIYYSFLLYPLLLSFFNDQYMSLFSTWLQCILYLQIFLLLNRYFISRKW
jgi:oligosaccharide repeat unit polymerase